MPKQTAPKKEPWTEESGKSRLQRGPGTVAAPANSPRSRARTATTRGVLPDLQLDSESLSRPGKGRSVAGAVQKHGTPFQDGVIQLERAYREQPSWLWKQINDASPYGPGADKKPAGMRLALFLVNCFIIEGLIAHANDADPPNSFSEALGGFLGPECPLYLHGVLECFATDALRSVEHQLSNQRYNSNVFDLLPYILEEHGQIFRSKIEKCDSARARRADKKKSGSFYTPSDVADFMVNAILEGSNRQGPWLDPACGSGVFLRAALKAHCRSCGHSVTIDSLMEYCGSNLFGIDINDLALDSAAFLLVADVNIFSIQQHHSTTSRFQKWLIIRRNLLGADTLSIPPSADSGIESIRSRGQQGMIFSETEPGFETLFPSKPEQFHFGILNPPYSSVPSSVSRLGYLSYRDAGRAAERLPAVPGFVEFLVRAIAPDGRAASVLPLSVACSSRSYYRNLRELLTIPTSRVEFHCFDREPHALFGEDVRTRNTIVVTHRDVSERSVWVTPLLQWCSTERQCLFDEPQLTRLTDKPVDEFVPKLGSPIQEDTYRRLRNSEGRGILRPTAFSRIKFKDIHLDSEADFLYVGSTGYRYINVLRNDGPGLGDRENLSSNTVTRIHFQSEHDSFGGLAILCSTLTRWLWRVEGDGFHVNAEFLKQLPMWRNSFASDVRQRLAEIGRTIWKDMTARGKVSVNKGRQTVSFHPTDSKLITLEVDQILIRHFELPESVLYEICQSKT